jgi:hypothetical protein
MVHDQRRSSVGQAFGFELLPPSIIRGSRSRAQIVTRFQIADEVNAGPQAAANDVEELTVQA